MYSFQEEIDDFNPTGKYKYFFYQIGGDDRTKVVEADSSQEAYRHLHHYVGSEWNEWVCVGRKDILEYKVEVHDKYSTLKEARCPTTGLHPLDFASANEETVERWDNDEE